MSTETDFEWESDQQRMSRINEQNEKDEKDRFENGIEYKVEVVETYTQKRSYVVTARSRQEARQLAKEMDWDDAYDGWDSDGSDHQQYLENQLPELDKATVKKIRKY